MADNKKRPGLSGFLDEHIGTILLALSIGFGVYALLAITFGFLAFSGVLKMETMGQFGDTFGIVTSFVTSLALFGVVYNIHESNVKAKEIEEDIARQNKLLETLSNSVLEQTKRMDASDKNFRRQEVFRQVKVLMEIFTNKFNESVSEGSAHSLGSIIYDRTIPPYYDAETRNDEEIKKFRLAYTANPYKPNFLYLDMILGNAIQLIQKAENEGLIQNSREEIRFLVRPYLKPSYMRFLILRYVAIKDDGGAKNLLEYTLGEDDVNLFLCGPDEGFNAIAVSIVKNRKAE